MSKDLREVSQPCHASEGSVPDNTLLFTKAAHLTCLRSIKEDTVAGVKGEREE